MENQFRFVLGMHIDQTSYASTTDIVISKAIEGAHGYVCAANVHMVMEALDDPVYRRMINAADLVTPDGVPLVWALRLFGVPDAQRVYGPLLTLHVCERAAAAGVPVGFFGGTKQSLDLVKKNLMKKYLELQIVYSFNPPFRPHTKEEDGQVVKDITSSGARILFVGLGCPKQERWMAEHKDRIPAVMLGVGAAFDFIAGLKPQAPLWMQNTGLEWLFRLATEPRRLWRRYLYHNPRFIFHFGCQLLGLRKYDAH